MKHYYAASSRKGIAFVFFFVISFFPFCLKAQTFPAGFQTVRIAQNLNPTDMKFSPDGQYLFVTDKSGKIFLSHNDNWVANPVIDFSAMVDPFNERGFTHIAVDPDFASNGFLYVYYTVQGLGRNRVARFTFDFNTQAVDPASHLALLDLEPMVAAIHTGGALNFGADGKLYVTTGESSNPLYSQSTGSVLGKVLRMNKDGTIPTDNPFYNALSGIYRYIYAIGMRNPFSADVQPGTGRYFVCDVGQSLFEEVNEILPGKNYGWSLVEGPKPANVAPPANYVDPVFSYPHDSGCAIIGGVFYNPSNNGFPTGYLGKFFYGDYCNQTIKILDPVSKTKFGVFATSIGRPVSFAVSPSTGAFYYLDRGGIPYAGSEEDNTSTNEGVLWKVVYSGSLAPTIAVHPDTVITSVGSNASFGIIANGLDLAWRWQRNGTDIPGASQQAYTLSNVQLTDSGALFRCIVTNQHGSDTSREGLLRVTNRPPPLPVITLPAEGFTYVAGTTLNFSGSANDPVDGDLPASRLTWKVDFHHDEHSHPVLAVTSGIASGSFAISAVNEVSDNVWYRIYLTAENDLGIKTTIFRDVLPQKVTLTLQAHPGIAINVDGTNMATPGSLLSVKGVIRSLTAPLDYMIDDSLYNFVRWGNGSTNPILVFATPAADSTITAVYSKKAVWNGTGLTGQYYNLAYTQNFSGNPVLNRIDPSINFNWATTSPDPAVRIDQFCVRWTGFVQPRTSGTYTFYVNSNDGVRLYINNQPLIDEWHTQATFETQGSIVLQAGTPYSIRLEYFEDFGDAIAELRWSGPDVSKQIIPTNALFAAVGAPLPVNFLQFSIKPNNHALQLFWKVEDLGNVKDYTIERRKAGAGNFEALATVAANSGPTYTYTDRAVNKNIVYEYRIKQTDHDGRYVYSRTGTGLLSGSAAFGFVIVPNPAGAQKQVQLVFTEEIENASVQVLTASGQIKLNKNLQAVAGQSLELSLEGLPAGTYYIKVISKSRVISKKLLIQ
jgi:glucose/arabinose dehydrogenase